MFAHSSTFKSTAHANSVIFRSIANHLHHFASGKTNIDLDDNYIDGPPADDCMETLEDDDGILNVESEYDDAGDEYADEHMHRWRASQGGSELKPPMQDIIGPDDPLDFQDASREVLGTEEEYERLLVSTAAYEWLLNTLCNRSLLTVPDRLIKIRTEIYRHIPTLVHVSRTLHVASSQPKFTIHLEIDFHIRQEIG